MSSPTPRLVVRRGSRSRSGTRCSPHASADSRYAVGGPPGRPTSSTRPGAMAPRGPLTDRSWTVPPRAACIASRNPGPPSTSGHSSIESPGAQRAHPAAIARAASGALSVPPKLSGATSTRMKALWPTQRWRPNRRPSCAVWEDQTVSAIVESSTTGSFDEPAPSVALLLLGQGRDLFSERGVECTGALPAASDPDLVERARVARAALGERAFILGHHYQRDEIIQFADVSGDSFKLARDAAARPDAEFIIFCGVHFMAEMAAINQVEEAWDVLADAGVADETIPVTYMNSTAAIKAFTGRRGGTVCTSSNAEVAMRWAFDQVGGRDGTGKVLVGQEQHLA